MSTTKKYKIYKLDDYVYRELVYFCLQYPRKKAELSACYGAGIANYEGMPHGSGTSNPTASQAERRTALYAALAQVPAGFVVSYGQLAAYAGLGRAARWVGRTLSQLPDGSTYCLCSSTELLTDLVSSEVAV